MTSKRQFSKVHPQLWQSVRFRGLESADAKLLHLFFLTSQHQTSAGAYRIPDGYAADDLGWQVERYRKARAALVVAGLIMFDEACSTVYVHGWFRWCPPMNPKHAAGTQRIILDLESEAIAEQAMEDFQEAYAVANPTAPQPQPGVSSGLREKLAGGANQWAR